MDSRKGLLCFSSFFGIRSNIFRDFSGCRLSILISEMIIRFVFPLAFQRRIPNYSTAKTREATAKTRHTVQNDGKGGRGMTKYCAVCGACYCGVY